MNGGDTLTTFDAAGSIWHAHTPTPPALAQGHGVRCGMEHGSRMTASEMGNIIYIRENVDKVKTNLMEKLFTFARRLFCLLE